ncbi:MAG: tetratricopeptide repeat protein [Chthoniobacterales bacterium]
MIQPIKSERNEWRISWVDLEDPLPCSDEADFETTRRFFLPTVVLITGQNGKLVDRPRLLEELDQPQIETYLESLFDQHGQPTCLAVESSEDWEEKGWQRFSRDYRIELHFTEHRKKSTASKEELARNLADSLRRDRKSVAQTPKQIAEGLTATAHRTRSADKRTALFRKALELDPECVRARVELGDIEFQQSNWSNALRDYEDVIARETQRIGRSGSCSWSEESSRAYLRSRLGRVMVLWQYGKYDEAASECEILLELNPVDNQGARFFLPMLYLLSDEIEKAQAVYIRYGELYPGDYQEPSFLFGWGLVLSLADDESGAKARYKEGILKNMYIPPLLLEQPLPPNELWLPNDRADLTYAHEFMDSYAILWDRDAGALRSLREAYEEIFPRVKQLIAHRRHMLEFQDQRYDPDYREKWQKFLAADEALLKQEA